MSAKPLFKYISPQYIDLLCLSPQEVETTCNKLKAESNQILAATKRPVSENSKFKVFHYVAWDGTSTNFDCLFVFASSDMAQQRLDETKEMEKILNE